MTGDYNSHLKMPTPIINSAIPGTIVPHPDEKIVINKAGSKI